MNNSKPWTVENVPDMRGKTVIITGANSGIGFEAAKILGKEGATVVMACRDLQKGAIAAENILAEFSQAALDLQHLDLAELNSIRDFCQTFNQKYMRLDILINNAGVMAIPKLKRTVDGFETQFGTNHLGHFALTGLVWERLLETPGARVVCLSSASHWIGWINFDNLNAERYYFNWFAYGQSKLANLLFVYELQRRFEKMKVDALALAAHPGWTETNLQRYARLFRNLNPIFSQPPEIGVLPTLRAAVDPEAIGGDFYGPDRFYQMRGHPVKVWAFKRASNPKIAKRLWEVSEKLTGIKYAKIGGTDEH